MNVKFYSVKLKATFTALESKDPLALYWIAETSELYKGDQLFGTGAIATQSVAGLLSPEDKAKLDELVAASGNLNLTAVDGTIRLNDIVGGKSIGVAVSSRDDNALVTVDDGLFVPIAKELAVPEYAIEKQEVAEDGYAISYKLKRTVDGDSTYVGDTINIAKDMVLKGATLETVVEANVPYVGAEIGDPYIDMVFNDTAESHIYIPVSGLVDSYVSGDGIEIVDGKISVKISPESNGLRFVDGALSLALATNNAAGALSPVDKAFIDSIPEVYATKEFVKETAVQVKYEVVDTPEGTIVNYGEKEIRIMCPTDVEFVKQNVGTGGDQNTYYMTFKTYAPDENVVGYREHLGDKVDSEILTDLKTDKYGRRYQPTWLGLAKYDDATGTWAYYGAKSSINKYIGWDYQIDWYDANGVMVASDSIRINLSNEDCHNSIEPYYMKGYATVAQIEALEDIYSWGEL
jgi:hypothetical protein